MESLTSRLVGTATEQTQEVSILEQRVKDLGCTIKALEMQLKGRDDLVEVEKLYDKVKEWRQKYAQLEEEAQALQQAMTAAKAAYEKTD